GDAFGDDPGLDARQAGQHNGGAVVGVEALGFDQAGALEPGAGLSPMLRDHAWLSSRLLASRRRGEDPDFAVGENAVDIEKNESNVAGASGSRRFRHRRNSSRLRVG